VTILDKVGVVTMPVPAVVEVAALIKFC